MERCVFDSFEHGGLALSDSNTVQIKDVTITKSYTGIEMGYCKNCDSFRVYINHSYVTKNKIGIRIGDDYKFDYGGEMHLDMVVP
eukprot:UN33119